MALCSALFTLLLFAPAADFLAEGLKALDANQPAAAEPLLRHAIEADANDISAHFNLALALSMQQKDSEAILELRKTLELQPGLYQAQMNLGILLLRDRLPADALPVLKDAAESKPDTPQKAARANFYFAQALFETGDLPHAEERYRTALELDSQMAAAQSGLARTLLREGKLPEAAEHFRAAADRDPQYRDGLLELAAAYEKANKLPDAIAIYKDFPDNVAVKTRLGQLLVENGDSAAAIPALELAAKTNPSVANHLALADAYKLNKQPDKTIEQLQLAAATDPSNYDLRMFLGRELRDAHKGMAAAQQFNAAAKIRPDSVQAWNELASILVVNEDYADGLAALDRVRALGKEVPGDLYYRAIALEKLRQAKPAMEAYRQFLGTDGGRMPDQEFLARQRIRIIESELNRK